MLPTAQAPACPPPDRQVRKPKFLLPRGAWDCQAHIFGPFDRFPLSDARSYTPVACPIEEYLELLNTLGFDRGVVVQGGAHSTDNRAMLEALERFPQRLRGVAVIEPGRPKAELERMHRLGVRGVRMSTLVGGSVRFDKLDALAAECNERGWHVILHFNKSSELLDVEPVLQRIPGVFMLDHLGRVQAEEGISSPQFATILRLLDTGRCWIKLSSQYRLSACPYPYEDRLPMIHEVVARRPDRVVWASNWPHPILWDRAMPNDADLVDLIPIWAPSREDQLRMLVENPLQLYA